MTHTSPATTESDQDAAPQGALVRSAMANGLGNVLEWFDWTTYAVFSPFIAKALFDPKDPVSAVLATLAVFAIGFFARPLGGIVFGILADKLGRRPVLITTMVTVAAGSLIIALIPGYAQIGGLASLLLLIARLIQGFAHGGESATAYAYIAEIAPRARRGFWSSSIYVAVGIGTVLATLLGAVITSSMSAQEVDAWGWRIPFAIGALLGFVAIFIRRRMVESKLSENADPAGAATAGAASTETTTVGQSSVFTIGLKLFLFVGGTTVLFYTWGSAAAAFAISAHGMDASGAFWASLVAQVLAILPLPLFGLLSDRVGRKPLLIFFLVGFIVILFPLFALLGEAPWTLLVTQSIALILLSLCSSIYPAVLSEQMPNRYRTRIIGVAWALSVAIFGGTAPLLNTWFASIGQSWIFNVYVIALALISLIVVVTWRETKGIDLRTV